MGKQQDREKIVQEIKVAADLYRTRRCRLQRSLDWSIISCFSNSYTNIIGPSEIRIFAMLNASKSIW